MKRLWKKHFGKIQLAVILIAATVFAYILPIELFKKSSSVIAAFLGLTIASLIPAMMLAATSLNSTQQNIVEFLSIKEALAKQISFFSGLIIYAIVLATLLIVGETVEWNIPSYVLKIEFDKVFELTISWSRFLNASVLAILFLILIRLFTFLGAVKSLFELHAHDRERDIRKRINSENRLTAANLDNLPKRKNFGNFSGTVED